ncbi:MAG TPA: putative baseplate assembly protein [Allosphingosinicella sp.]|nr:putative baseplate assembly protein [Allosphingosinicella sp.]
MLDPQADALNRPALSAISYRVGTFESFRRAMLESIHAEPRLAALTTRSSDDYAVSIIELFAAVGDVLTFYNERIANELFLGTARERDSVLRLVRLIGYQLRPGLAATALLSFALDAGAETRIRKGLPVMSVPGQDELPQTFETIEQIVAHAELNEVPAFAPPVASEPFRQGGSSAPVAARPASLGVEDRFLIFGGGTIEEKRVVSLARGPGGERLVFDPPIQAPGLWPGVARAARLLGRLRFFGHNVAASQTVVVPGPPPTWSSQAISGGFALDQSSYPLDGRYDDLRPGAQLLVDAGPGQVPRLRTAVVTGVDTRHASLGPLEDSVTHVALRQTIRGRPAVVAGPTGGHVVMATSGTGAVLQLDGNPPHVWLPMEDGQLAADLAFTLAPGFQTDLLIRDARRTLRQRRTTWGWGHWGPWVDHGGSLTSAPRPLLAGSTLRVFARGDDLGLWMIDATSASPGTWVGLGGVLTSAPVPVSIAAADLMVFARGADRALWVRRLSGSAWADWESLGGELAGAPAAVSAAAGRVDVVAVGPGGTLLHRGFDGAAWSAWRDLGGEAVGEPATVASAPDRVEIFVRDRGGALRHIARHGGSWTAWEELDGKLASAPAAIRDGAALHVYARGADGSLVHRSRSGGAWQPWRGFGDGLGPIADRRSTRIFEIAPGDIELRDFDYPDAIAGGRLALPLSLGGAGFDKLAEGRRILLASGKSFHPARVAGVRRISAVPGEASDHLLVDFAPAPPAPLRDVRLHGNVAEASHGETQPDEALGHGNAAVPFQTMELQRAPLTYLPSAADIAGEAALEVRVNGERWREVPSLFGRKPVERVYTARQADEGQTILTFGDGRTGSRLPSGAVNLIARYRKGLGLAGRMKPGQLSVPLERPPGLRAVVNPLAADGAADPESRDNARHSAPGTVRTFGRAVSLRDFEWLAISSGMVERAYVTWVWRELERAVHLTVAAPGGAPLSAASLARLHAALRSASDPNRPLFLANLVRVPVLVKAKLVVEPAFEADAVLDSARAALLGLFAFEAMPLGYAVHASSVYARLQGVEGVRAVDLDLFHFKGHAGLTAAERAIRSVVPAAVQPHIRVFPARPAPALADIDRFARAGFEGGSPPPVLAAEQVHIADPDHDIHLIAVESL